MNDADSREPYEKPQIIRHDRSIVHQFGASPGRRLLPDIDGVPVPHLIARFGSPLFVFQERDLRDKAVALRKAFRERYPRVLLAWSYKTNDLDAICGVFHQEGWAAEVVSGAEYAMARRLGCPGDRIIFNGACKRAEELALAVDEGALIQLDHFDELQLLDWVASMRQKRARVGIRVNMMVESLGLSWDRFGFNLEAGEAFEAARRVVDSESLDLIGLHCHLGTYIMQPEAYREAARRLGDLAAEIEEKLEVKIDAINMGGGLPSHSRLHGMYNAPEDSIPPVEKFAEAICEQLKESFKARKKDLPLLILENGRALCDEAGTLLATVMGTRRVATGGRALVLDAGVNLLYTATWYHFEVLATQFVAGRLEDTSLYGPLCMAIDVLRRGLMLPPLEAGHVIAIRPVGAYNVTQWMQFSQMRPAVVMIGSDFSVEVIRRAETIEDLKNTERLPEQYRPDFAALAEKRPAAVAAAKTVKRRT